MKNKRIRSRQRKVVYNYTWLRFNSVWRKRKEGQIVEKVSNWGTTLKASNITVRHWHKPCLWNDHELDIMVSPM